jgi:uncharacterized membrane protein
MLAYLVLIILTKQSIKTVATAAVYFVFIAGAYFLHSMSFIKLIPVLLSAGFFLFFLSAYFGKKELILGFAKRFSPKQIPQKEQEYLAASDGYWSGVLLGNTLIQILFLFYENNVFWAIYSSVGWYIYMFIALIIQLIYVKIQVSKGQ